MAALTLLRSGWFAIGFSSPAVRMAGAVALSMLGSSPVIAPRQRGVEGIRDALLRSFASSEQAKGIHRLINAELTPRHHARAARPRRLQQRRPQRPIDRIGDPHCVA